MQEAAVVASRVLVSIFFPLALLVAYLVRDRTAPGY
jgi:hypothetical protein